MDKSSQTYFIVFAAFAAAGILVQAAVLAGIFIGVRKVQSKLLPLIDSIHSEVLPAAVSAGDTLRELAPKLKTITANLAEVSAELRSTSGHVGDTVRDIMARTRVQTAQIDGMIESALDQINSVGNGIQHAIALPGRHLNGILNGMRAGLDVLRHKEPVSHGDSDNDLFV